jgi:predicted regulator of Ras-like GTPase activity (Roadblock/LC7/MglB family)
MNRDSYAIALKTTLTEIQKAYPDLNHSFIFTKNENIISGEHETDEKTMNTVLDSFENLKEKAETIGEIKGFHIIGKKGNLTLSKINDIYLVLSTTKNMDNTHIHAITHVIIPTILKTMETIESPHLPIDLPQKKLVVDTLTGFFAGDAVQIDTEILDEWTQNNDPRTRVKAAITGESDIPEEISQVHIETFSGNTTVCKVKEVDDKNVKGKNMIKIPEKLAKSLEITKGDIVMVEPIE